MLVAVTGRFGAGKTTVCSYFRRYGAVVVDTDSLGKKFLHGKLKKRVVSLLGTDILTKNCIDTKKLAALVFSNKRKLAQLEHLIHPYVLSYLKKMKEQAERKGKIVFFESALLYQKKWLAYADSIILVKASDKDIIRRLEKRFSKEEILQRWKSQKIIKSYDFLIPNTTRRQLGKKVRVVWTCLNG